MLRPILLGLSLLVLGAVAAPAADEVIEATLEWEPGRLGTTRQMTIPFRASPPEGVEPLPGLGRGRYARIRWGDTKGLLVGLDMAPGKERLFVDTNGDGALHDETRSTWFAAASSGARLEEVLVAYEDEREPAKVTVRFYRHAGTAADRVQITTWSHRRGFAVLGGRLRAVALVDDNADFRFDDPKHDHLYVDVDGNGSFTAGTGSHEAIPVGEPFRAGTQGYRAIIPSASGRLVRFEVLAKAPPAPERRWPAAGRAASGTTPAAPATSYEDLAARVASEMDRPYADRYQAINEIGRTCREEALALLLRLERTDSDANVRAASVRAVGYRCYLEQGGKDVVRIATSKSSPATVASAAIQALHGMGHPDREPVYRALLESNESSIVGQAARYLAYLGTESAAKAVRAQWSRSTDTNLRYQVYQGLRSLPDGPPRKVMREAAASEHTSLAAQALRDLLLVDDPKLRSLALQAAKRRPVQEYLGKAIADVLGAIADAEAAKALLALAAEGTPALELHVAQRLAPVRDRGAVDALVSALKAKNDAIRDLAARTLAGIPEKRVTDALLARARRERDPLVLASMLEALGDHGDERAVEVLLKAARKRNDVIHEAAIRALARVGLGKPKVRSFFVGLLAAKAWTDRVLAIDAASAAGDARLCPRIEPNLGHAKRQVRLAAAEALGVLRCAESVEPLIRRLEKEDEIRVTAALADALYNITGMNLYDDAKTWREWWTREGPTFRMPETVRDLPPADAGGTRAGFYGIPLQSGRVIFVIDQSGSMSAADATAAAAGQPGRNRLDLAIKEVLAAVKGMNDRDYVNVILFHTTIHPWSDDLKRLSSKNRGALERHLLKQGPTGGTNLYDGLELALLDEEVDTIFLLSDGVPGSGTYVAKDDILRAVRRLNQTKRVAIHGISIGRDSDLLRELAEANGGHYVRR